MHIVIQPPVKLPRHFRAGSPVLPREELGMGWGWDIRSPSSCVWLLGITPRSRLTLWSSVSCLARAPVSFPAITESLRPSFCKKVRFCKYFTSVYHFPSLNYTLSKPFTPRKHHWDGDPEQEKREPEKRELRKFCSASQGVTISGILSGATIPQGDCHAHFLTSLKASSTLKPRSQ